MAVKKKKAAANSRVRRKAYKVTSPASIERTDPFCPFEIGKAYLFCGVTRYFVGRVTRITGPFVELAEASWVANTGRFSEAVSRFTLDEVERVPDGWIVNTAALNDAGPWNGDLPKVTQ